MTVRRPSYTHNAVMHEHEDGDSFDVRLDLGRYGTVTIDPIVPLRLAHIDAPDRERPAERAAASLFVATLLPVGTRLVVTTLKAEKYGRTLAEVQLRDEMVAGGYVWPPGADVATALVQLGHAVPYEGGPRA